MRNIDKKRFDFIGKVEKRALKIFERVENEFIRVILEEFENILIFKDGKIVNSTKNLVNLHKLGFFQDNFRKQKVTPVIGWIAKQLITLTKINTTYFKKDFNVRDISKKIEQQSLLELGVKQGTKPKILKGSLLDQFSRFESPYLVVRNAANFAISQQMDLKSFKTLIRKEIKKEGQFGRIKHHFYTIANDVFSRHDRNVQEKYASSLGLKVFIYTGGLINTSRDFCEERNRKVFTIEEAQKWKDLKWDGKNANYDPLKDMGGHNCRHFPSFISKKEAIRRRPDLKDYFKKLEDEN